LGFIKFTEFSGDLETLTYIRQSLFAQKTSIFKGIFRKESPKNKAKPTILAISKRPCQQLGKE